MPLRSEWEVQTKNIRNRYIFLSRLHEACRLNTMWIELEDIITVCLGFQLGTGNMYSTSGTRSEAFS